jgi:hypothetical protein
MNTKLLHKEHQEIYCRIVYFVFFIVFFVVNIMSVNELISTIY